MFFVFRFRIIRFTPCGANTTRTTATGAIRTANSFAELESGRNFLLFYMFLHGVLYLSNAKIPGSFEPPGNSEFYGRFNYL